MDTFLEYQDKIGEALLKKGIIDPKALEKALLIKQGETGRTRRSIAQILVQELGIDHDLIFSEVASYYAFKTLKLNVDRITSEQIDQIKRKINPGGEELRKLLIEKNIIPFFDENYPAVKIQMAAADPTDKEIPKVAHMLNIDDYAITYIKKTDFEQLLKKVFPPENHYLKNLEKVELDLTMMQTDPSLDESLLESEINKSALINLFEGALVEGVRQGASDIHIIPQSSRKTSVYFRLDGKLKHWHTQENTMPEAIAAVVKDRSRGFDRFEREKAQDGYIQREIDGQLIRFRVSVLPLAGVEVRNKFESVVIRILDDRKIITDLDKLGLTGYAREAFEKSIRRPQGMVILTGPTGSGKSTTLVAALHQVICPDVNVLTIEDPVEYAIKGARQLKISHKMNFELALRSILRHDPDIVFVGEIRDKETADIAVKLANTGHLTFTTLHTNDAASAISRLYKMGIEPFLLAYSINIIVAQRLIRRLCHCKHEIKNVDKYFLNLLELDPEPWKEGKYYTPVGCEDCGYTGYNGRIAIHEVISFTNEIRKIIFTAGSEIDEEKIRIAAKKDGSISLRDSGFEKVKLGLTTFEEVIANTMEI